MLLILPKLKISYGPAGFPLLGITVLKFLLTIFIAIVFNFFIAVKKQIKSYKKFSGLLILLFLNFLILACEIYGLYFEPLKVEVSTIEVTTGKLKLDKSIKIAQISDLHIEKITKRELLVLEKIKSINPDIIVLTGDYLNLSFTYDPQTIFQTRDFLTKLIAPYGVYAVTSSLVDTEEVVKILFKDLHIKLLEDAMEPVEFNNNKFYLIGVNNVNLLLDKLALLSLADKLPPESFKLLLYHTPDLIEPAVVLKIDLYLTGHTHGGQIRLPFYGALITASVFDKKFEKGLYEIMDTKMYVSRGLGMEGNGAPRARFLSPPEIVVINIKSE